MLKKIMFTGVLLITISVLHAKSVNSFKSLISTPVPGTTDEQLVNRIAADNDFKKYYISNVEFANKIIETKAGGLFLKYVQNKINPAECTILFRSLDVKSKKEFDEIAVNLGEQARALFNKFPELKLRTEKEQKELLVSAFKKMSIDKSIMVQFAKAKTITMEQCFWIWMTCNSLCAISCSYDSNYSSCIWQCTAACAASYGTCWVIAE